MANYPYIYSNNLILMNIVVTGASQGIGLELVKNLSMDPQNRIMAIARNHDALKNLQFACREDAGNEIFILSKDISELGFHYQVAQEIAHKFGQVDVLVNNAGLLINKAFSDLDEDDFDRMFGVNVKSAFLMIRMMLPFFNRPAHIVNIGSMGGYQGSVKFPGLSLYSASKGALAILTECLAEELKEKEINVNCLALGSARTEMMEKAFPDFKAPVSAMEMAGFISDFALRGHRFFNGKIIPVAVTTP